MNDQVFIWTGHFSSKADFEQYIATENVPFLRQEESFLDEDDEEAMSQFAEDIDLPIYDVDYQKYCWLEQKGKETENDKEELLAQLLGEVSYAAEVIQLLNNPDKPSFNVVLLIYNHNHTRYYRGAARPGAPVRHIGTFDKNKQ